MSASALNSIGSESHIDVYYHDYIKRCIAADQTNTNHSIFRNLRRIYKKEVNFIHVLSFLKRYRMLGGSKILIYRSNLHDFLNILMRL